MLEVSKHQNLLFNKNLKLPIVSTQDSVFVGFYVDDITLGETAAFLTVSILPDACLGQSGLRI